MWMWFTLIFFILFVTFLVLYLTKDDGSSTIDKLENEMTEKSNEHEDRLAEYDRKHDYHKLYDDTIYLSKESMEYLYQTLYDVQNILDHFGIEHWITGGSLLAILRGNAHLPWDDDLDIVVHNDDLRRIGEKEIQEVFIAHGYSTPYYNPDWPRYIGFYPMVDGHKQFHIDFFGTEDNGEVLHSECFRKHGIHDMRKENIYPITQYQYGPIKVNGPANIEGHLLSTNHLTMADVENYRTFHPHDPLSATIYTRFEGYRPSSDRLKQVFQQYKGYNYTIKPTMLPDDKTKTVIEQFCKKTLPKNGNNVKPTIRSEYDGTGQVQLTDHFIEQNIAVLTRAKQLPIRPYELQIYYHCLKAKQQGKTSVRYYSDVDLTYIAEHVGLEAVDQQIVPMIEDSHMIVVRHPERIKDPFQVSQDSVLKYLYITWYELMSCLKSFQPQCIVAL